MVLAAVASLLLSAGSARAASWKGLEPFVSKRADVERVLGAPVADRMAQEGSLKFNVSGGSVMVFFVTARFVATTAFGCAHGVLPNGCLRAPFAFYR